MHLLFVVFLRDFPTADSRQRRDAGDKDIFN